MTGELRSETAIFLRFALVGGSFSGFYALVSALLINLTSFSPFVLSVGLFIACVPFAFLAQQHFAFRAAKLRRHAFWMYLATQVSSIAAVSWITTRFVTYNVLWDTLIMGVTVGIAAVISYLIGRLLTFRAQA